MKKLDRIRHELEEAQQVLANYLADDAQLNKIEQAAEILIHALKHGGKVYSCGNGGSMSDAMHFAEELSGRFRDNRKALAATAISDPAFLSCAANDFGYEFVFSRYLEAMASADDVLLVLSTSGNSLNILNAVKEAQSKGMKVIGLTGKDGGKLADLVDVELRAPMSKYSDRAQEMHIKIIHTLVCLVEDELC